MGDRRSGSVDLAGSADYNPVTPPLRRAVEGDIAVLPASMLVDGLTGDGFARWAIDFAPDPVTIDASGLSLESDAGKNLADAVAAAAADPHFFTTFAAAAHAAAGRLVEQARSMSATARQSPSRDQLVQDLAHFAEAARGLAPALVATPLVREQVKRLVIRRTAGVSADDPELAERLAWAGHPPAAVEAIHDCYGIAAEIAGDERAAESVRELSGKGALKRLRDEHPSLHRTVVDHVERFGWLRAQSGDVTPMTPRELVQRMTIALVRWTPERIAEAAEPRRPWEVASLLGAPLSKELAGLIRILQQLTTGSTSAFQALARAKGVAWPYLMEVGSRLECEPVQLVFGTLAELRGALSDGEPLPVEEIDRRRSAGFQLQAEHGRWSLKVGGPPPAQPLPGQTGSMGRAVGRAKIITDADDGNRLRPGDVLVTKLSTPTYEGEPSLFPYRTVPSVGIEKAAAVVTDEGGLLSHAGIICRENSVPSIIGAEDASTTLIDGQVVEVDATKGAGRIIVWGSPLPPPQLCAEL